jgi:hypothetical protein
VAVASVEESDNQNDDSEIVASKWMNFGVPFVWFAHRNSAKHYAYAVNPNFVRNPRNKLGKHGIPCDSSALQIWTYSDHRELLWEICDRIWVLWQAKVIKVHVRLGKQILTNLPWRLFVDCAQDRRRICVDLINLKEEGR